MITRKFFFFLIAVCCYIHAVAQDVQIGGIWYYLDYKTAVVTNGRLGGLGNYVYSGDIVIPSRVTYEGIEYIVESIDPNAFSGNKQVTSVAIGDFVERIYMSTFSGCSSLGSVALPKHIKCIEDDAFEYCSSLSSITFPDSLTTIGKRAFEGCSALSAVTIPSSVTSLGDEAFKDCKGLKTLEIKEGLTSIGYSVFEGCSSLNDISFPAGIKTIGDHAFSGCIGLTSLVLPEYLETLGYCSFVRCENLTSVTFSDNLTTIGASCFAVCEKLVSIIIPNSVKYIEDNAFDACSGIKNITIGKSVSNIGFRAFASLENLTDVVCYADEVPKTDTDAFSDSKLDSAILYVPDYSIESYKNDEIWNSFKDLMPIEKITDFTLNYYVDGELYKSYKHKYGIEIIPEQAPQKEGYTFNGWGEIPETMPGKDVKVYGTFSRNEVKENGVIYWALNEKAVVLGNDNASGDVSIAKNVIFNVKELPVTEILKNAFNGCKDVTSIEIPATITNISERAFAKIDKLTDVTISAEEVPTTDRTTFENSYIDYVTLHVPAGSVEKYKAVGPWKDFKEIVAIEGTEPISLETCVMPTISFLDGKLEFESETDGAECHYEIKVEDTKEGVGYEVSLSSAYEISVYASKEGYNDSEKNTATLYWINVDPTATGLIENEMRVNANAILVQNTGGAIAITGVADSDNVLIYNMSGQLIAQGKASGSHVEIGTNLSVGDICIIKIADKSVKYLLK